MPTGLHLAIWHGQRYIKLCCQSFYVAIGIGEYATRESLVQLPGLLCLVGPFIHFADKTLYTVSRFCFHDCSRLVDVRKMTSLIK